MGTSFSRDAAELPTASVTPDFAAAIDSDEERILDVISRMSLKLPTSISRAWLAAFFLRVLKDAAEDGTLAALFDHIEPTRTDLEMVSRILAEIIDNDRPRLQAKCLDFVFGLNLCEGQSEVEIAEQEGVVKGTVSKRCRRLKERFPEAPGRGMKSAESITSYRLRQTGKRAKPLPQPWAFSGMLTRVYAAR